MRRIAILALAALLLPSTALADDAPTTRPDELLAGGSAWLNVDAPLARSDAEGKLLLLDFWDYTCVNCIRTLRHLRQWHERYGDKGLLIVGVHSPEFSFAKEVANVRAGVERFRLTYPVVLDNDFEIWKQYNTRQVWPYKVLLAPDGRRLYDHAGEGGYAQSEQVIRRELKKLNPDVELPDVPAEDRAARGPRRHQTPELYANWRGVVSHQFAQRINARAAIDYKLPPKLTDDRLHLAGQWQVTREFARPGDGNEPFAAAVAVPFAANEVNAVFRPLGEGATTRPDGDAPRIRVLLDGKPLPEEAAGEDVAVTDGGAFLAVTAGRMYRIYDAEKYGRHVLRLEFENGEAGLFAFTFGQKR